MQAFELEKVADLALLMYEEAPYSFNVSRDQFLETLNNGVIVHVAKDPEDTIIGFVIGVICESHPIFGNVKYAAELAWYVHPDHRGKGTAVKLLNEFEVYARVSGCKFVVCAAMHNSSFDQVKSMYEKNGYVATEVSFIKELN